VRERSASRELKKKSGSQLQLIEEFNSGKNEEREERVKEKKIKEDDEEFRNIFHHFFPHVESEKH